MAVTISRLKDYIITIPSGGLVVRLAYDANDNVEYVGYAPPGSANGDASWRIIKLTYNSNYDISSAKYAQGVSTFTNVWSSRSSYGYS